MGAFNQTCIELKLALNSSFCQTEVNLILYEWVDDGLTFSINDSLIIIIITLGRALIIIIITLERTLCTDNVTGLCSNCRPCHQCGNRCHSGILKLFVSSYCFDALLVM